MKPSNILSCLEKVDEKYILEAAPQAYQPAAPRKLKKKFGPRLLIAAVLAVAIPIAAFAVTKGFGLLDYLGERGVKNPEKLEELSAGPEVLFSDISADSSEDSVWFTAGNAKFTVVEALHDNETVYLLAKVVPVSSDVFLIPQYFSREDSTVLLEGLEEIPEGTVEQYAAYLGKGLAVASIGYYAGGNHMDGAEDYIYGPDGSLYYYYTSNIPSDGTLTIDCRCSFYQDLEEASDRQTAEFTISLREAPEARVTSYESFDASIKEDADIEVTALTIEETGLGCYATFEFRMEEILDLSFLLTDSSGNTLPSLPSAGSGLRELGDGVYSLTVSCQTPEEGTELCFVIYDYVEGIKYGPYHFQ